MEKLHLIRDRRGGFLETDLSRLVVPVHLGHTWPPQPKAPRQKAGSDGFDESTGQTSNSDPRAPADIARLSFLPQSFEAVGPLVQKHKRQSSATGQIAA